MANTIQNEGLSLGAASGIPAIQSFQIDPSGLGGIAESVNLYRGDVNVPLNLVSFQAPGGIEASVTILYHSNVGKSVDQWNLDAPTGPLGLGWSFGYEFIALSVEQTEGLETPVYYLVADGASNQLFQTGQTTDYREFETEGYQYWQIRYYFEEERWEIIKETGVRYIYGGSDLPPDSNPIQYGIKWSGKMGNWVDATVLTTGQQAYALGWNLAEIRSPWGNSILLEYENDVAQLGGNAGLEYTRSSRLKRVTDPAGRTFLYFYRPKRYDSEVREYQYPAIHPVTPNLVAYQFRLETQYLNHIEVRGPVEDPQLIFTLEFYYELQNIALGHEDDPDFYKRYLTEVVIRTQDGLMLPSFVFSYYNQEEHRDLSFNRGAIARITYPQGGSVFYSFKQTLPSGTERAMKISKSGIPRAWFGSDYAVMTHYEGAGGGLKVEIYMWNGLWIQSPATYHFPVEIDLSTLDVSAAAEFFAISFHTKESTPRLFAGLFHKEKGRYGQWLIEQEFTVLPISGGKQGIVVTGDEYAIVIASGGALSAKVWDRLRQTWLDRSQQFQLNPNAEYAIAAFRGHFALASYIPNNHSCKLEMYHLDQNERIFRPIQLQVDQIPQMLWDSSGTPSRFWALGSDYAVTTYITQASESSVQYRVQIQQWDDTFFAQLNLDKEFKLPGDTKLPFAQSVASGSVVANLGNLFRYDGADWIEGQLPFTATDSPPRFVYGSDAAIVSGETSSAISLYNPYKSAWELQSVSGPSEGIAPTISGNYLTMGRTVFFRNKEGSLLIVKELDPNMNRESLANRAPNFIAYQDDNENTHIFPLENGDVNSAGEIKLPGQQIVTNIHESGTQLVGVASLLTFEGSSFNDPKILHLYQYVNRTITGPVETWPVAALSIDDGMPSHWGQVAAGGLSRNTRYYYDCENVTVTPDGSVFEFAAATAVYGVPGAAASVCAVPPAETPFGRTEYRYHNNRTPLFDSIQGFSPGNSVYYYSYVAGSIFDKTDYDALGDPKNRDITLYDVRTEREPLHNPGTLVPLYGAYVKPKSVTTSTFLQTVTLQNNFFQSHGATGLPVGLTEALAAHGVNPGERHLVRTRVPGQWRLFPSPFEPLFIPIALRDGAAVAGIPVDRRVSYEYSFATGLLISDATESYNSQGLLEVARREVYYAWQVDQYKILKDRHILSPVALSIRLTREGENPGDWHATHIALTTYQQWFQDADSAVTRFAPVCSYEAREESMYTPGKPIPVHFSDWNNQQPPPESEWRLVGRVISRLPTGNVTEAQDVTGMPTTSIMNRADTLRVAEIANAHRRETSYLGFEPYEDNDGWAMAGPLPIAANIIRGDAHTGTQSLRMRPSLESKLERDFQLSPGRVYILSHWIKTPSSFGGDPGKALWTVKVDQQPAMTFAIAGTAGTWEYRHFRVEIPGPSGGSVNARVTAQNLKEIAANEMLLDDILVCPLDGGGSATVYDALTTAVTASLSANGGTTRVLTDSYQRNAATVSVSGEVSSGLALYLVRQVDRSNPFVFPANNPNSGCQVDAPGGGVFADFYQGESWRSQWLSGDFDNWKIRDGRMVYLGTKLDTIRFAPTQNARDFGVRVSVFPPLDSAGKPVWPKEGIGISIGDSLSAQWESPSGWRLTLDKETITIPGNLGTDWMLLTPVDPVTKLTSVFFLMDGRLIFGRIGTTPVSGIVSLFTQTAGFAFSSIATFRSPRISMTYLDGSAKERQKQSFTGSGIAIGGSVYDAIGRAALGVKTIQIDNAPLGFVPDYVNTFDPITGILTGRAADAYPADEGYPYTRTEFFPTAQSLARAQGLPGKNFAIVQTGVFGSETAVNNHVSTFRYGTNTQGQFGSSLWPSSQYFATAKQDPNGNFVYTLTTKADQKIAEMAGPTPKGAFNISHYFYDGAGHLVRKLPPAGVAAQQAGDPEAEKWATVMQYDFLGQQIALTTPDTGTTQYIYDRASRPRFVLNADGANTKESLNTILYMKYDSMGREVEGGYFEAVWKPAELREKALNDPNWPDSSQPHVVRGLTRWDGDGNDPLLFGRMAESITYTDSGDQSVHESFVYNLAGAIIGKTLVAPEFDTTPRTITYAYNAMGEPIQTGYPAGSTTPIVTHSYDLSGRIIRVGTPEVPDAFATYSYDPLGNIETEMLPSDVASIERLSEYNQPGWPVVNRYSAESAGLIFQEKLTYTEGGFEGSAYFDGTIASAATQDETGGFLYQYKYDGVSELTVAANNTDPDASLGVAGTTEYDPNGNILELTEGGISYQYNYPQYTNRLATVTAEGQAVDQLAFNRNGAVTSSKRLNLSSIHYDRVSGLTSQTHKTTQLDQGIAEEIMTLAYSGDGKRATKIVTDKAGKRLVSRLYVRGTQDLPLFEANAAPGSTRIGDSQFIYGPDGLVALHSGAKQYRVIKDRQGSVRRVVDETGAVVATFDYAPFGGRVTGLGQGKDDILYYRYTGQEFDPETGLYNYQARMYDPQTRRFFAPDPAGQYASSYVFTGNNPVNLVDPNGEEALTAFLIIVLVSAIIGAVAGAITYAVSHQGNFDVGKFFAYAAVGFVAGAVAGATSFGAGLLATAALATVGVSTSTSIASGIVVGIVSGAADGAVSGSLNQIGVNLVEGKNNVWEGVGTAAWQGAAIGGVVGGVAGGITGAVNKRTSSMLKRPGSVIAHDVPEPYGNYRGIPQGQHYGPNQIPQAGGENGVLAIVAHGGNPGPFRRDLVLEWAPSVGGAVQKDVNTIIGELGAGFTPRGIDLTGVCWGGSNGVARSFANNLRVPVRAANVATTTNMVTGQTYIRWYRKLFQFGTFRTYYPSQLKTGWIALFGY